MQTQLTQHDIAEYAHEEINLMLSNHHSGLYDADTDKVYFSVTKLNDVFEGNASLYCLHPGKNELELVKEVSCNHFNKHTYNKTIQKVILLYRLFGKEVPEVYEDALDEKVV